MGKKILAVEDNRVTLKFIVNTLQKEGHQVLSAEDGLEALEILTSFTPDILFVDLVMPKIGGEKLCQIVRKMPHLDNCYIIVISGAVVEMDLDYAQIGANACIAKGPFDKMSKHILKTVKESDILQESGRPKPIMGLDTEKGTVYARQMTRELLSRNHHLETILESITDGIVEVYSNKVVYANSTAVSILGLPPEKLLALNFFDIFDESHRPRIEPLLHNKNNKPYEIGYKDPLDYHGKLVVAKSLPVKSDPLTTIILLRDVTARSQLEMQFQHGQKMEAIGTISSGVAHNFRNILTGILTNAQIIFMNHEDLLDLNQPLNRIISSVHAGAQMVDRLLLFSRKQIKAEFKQTNLVDIINGLYDLIKESFDKKIKIQNNAPKALFVTGDASSLGQALMNLFTNAQDAMPDGGLLKIETKSENGKAAVVISDNGTGMTQETIKKCFDPFFTTKAIGKGTGLGLSTTYGIIKSHEGDIHVESRLGKGTTFKVFLPLAGKIQDR